MLTITELPLWNKQLTANNDKKHIHQIKTTYTRSALPMTNMYAY